MEMVITRRNGIDYTILFDSDDQDLINCYQWHITVGARGLFAARGYLKGEIAHGNQVYMHRLIMGLPDISLDVHHKDENTLNNHRYNLEILSKSEHQFTKLPRNCKNCPALFLLSKILK